MHEINGETNALFYNRIFIFLRWVNSYFSVFVRKTGIIIQLQFLTKFILMQKPN